MKKILIQKIESNDIVIGIIGLGYVGLPLSVAFSEVGIKVIGFEKSIDKITKINNGQNYINDVDDTLLRNAVKNKILSATNDFQRINECDAILICVPTPLDKFRKPDMSYIENACLDIGRNMKKGTFISLESTTYPTTTEDFMLPIIEQTSGFKHNIDFWLAFSPERVDPGNQLYNTKNTPKVLGAITSDGVEIGEAIYSKAIKSVYKVSSPRVAEMVKILENSYRLVNISLINELALLSGKMNINIWEVIEAAKTKPFGFQAFYPGPGIGGHCIPLDPFYLEHIAKKFDFELSMIHAAGHINMRMPHYMYIKIASALNSQKKSVNGSNILFIGVAYKPDINDYRESPALEIIDVVMKKGGNVKFYDPYINEIITNKGYHLFSESFNKELLTNTDLVVLTTNHSNIDVNEIIKSSKLIVDLRNMIKINSDKIFKL